MTPEDIQRLFEEELGELSEEDKEVLEANRKSEEASQIISGTT